jgi:hypothetical protein
VTVEQVVRERLLADVTLAALVGTRVYMLKLPQKPTLPAVRVQLITEPRGYQLRGEDGAVRSRVQVDAYQYETATDPYDSVSDVADAASTALSGHRFTDAGSPVSLEVTGAFRQSRRVLYEAEEFRLIRISQDFIVWSKAA